MFVFRSLTLGLLGACFLLIATRPVMEVHRVRTMQPPTTAIDHLELRADHLELGADRLELRADRLELRADRAPDLALREGSRPIALPPAVVDVAPGVSASQLASLVRLDAGEHVATIDDEIVAGDLDAGVKLAALDLRARRYIDLGVQGPRGARRVLVLLH